MSMSESTNMINLLLFVMPSLPEIEVSIIGINAVYLPLGDRPNYDGPPKTDPNNVMIIYSGEKSRETSGAIVIKSDEANRLNLKIGSRLTLRLEPKV